MEPAVELERFAALSAEIEAGAARDEVCAREGISVEAWTGAQEAWLARMAEETAAKRFDLTNRYNAAFVARRLALQDGKRKPANKPARAAKKPPAPPRKAPEPVAAPPPKVEGLPTFLEAAAAGPPPPLAVPQQVVAPPPPLAAPPLERHVNDDAGGMTVVAISPFAQQSALPFQGSGAASAPPANRPSGAQRGGLPFQAAGPAAAAPPAPPAPPALPPPASQEFGAATVVGAISPFARGEALPFRGGGGAPGAPSKAAAPAAGLAGLPFRAGSPAAASTPQPPPNHPPNYPASERSPGQSMQPATAPMAPMGAPSSSRSSALPFTPAARRSASTPPPAPAAPPAAPPAAHRSRFSLEQFASLAAEIAAAPAKVAEVRARYGLDEASHRREAEAWNQRFSTDAELYRRYGALFKSYRDWLSRTPR